jgi:hypothetical protein
MTAARDPGVAALLHAVLPNGQQEALQRHQRAQVQAERLPKLLACATTHEQLARRLVEVMQGPQGACAYLIEVHRQTSAVFEELMLCVQLLDADTPPQPPTQSSQG